jgi:hypothetical protein
MKVLKQREKEEDRLKREEEKMRAKVCPTARLAIVLSALQPGTCWQPMRCDDCV